MTVTKLAPGFETREFDGPKIGRVTLTMPPPSGREVAFSQAPDAAVLRLETTEGKMAAIVLAQADTGLIYAMGPEEARALAMGLIEAAKDLETMQ